MGQLQSKVNGGLYEGVVLVEKYALKYGFKEVMMMMMMMMMIKNFNFF